MGLFSGAMKAGVAKKVMDEARKPQNKRKIKDFVSGFGKKGKGKAPRGRA